MELTPKQQAVELIKKSGRILILTHKKPFGDGVAASVALKIILEKLGKEASVAIPEFLPSSYAFLPEHAQISTDFSGTRDFIVSVDVAETSVDKLGYRIENGKLNIIITPKKGSFSSENLSSRQGEYKYDLIVVLDSCDLDQLGRLFEESAEIFYETPVVNIDHHAANDNFGKVNLIDLTATSTCEILVSLIESLGGEKNLFDEDVATALLSGIIADTDSFQNAATTPKSFTVAAQLVAAGARQQEIIASLFRAKPISTLRLWGRILASIREDSRHKMIWSYVLSRDLEQTMAKKEDIEGAIDELMTTAQEAEIVLVLAELPEGTGIFLRTVRGVDASAIAQIFGKTGSPNSANFILEKRKITQTEKEILEKIRQFQAKRLGVEDNSVTTVSQLPVQAKGSKPVEKGRKKSATAKEEAEAEDKKSKPAGRILTQYPKHK